MFVLEAIPAIVMGIACPLVLSNGPAQARWLTSDQRTWLMEKLAHERSLARTAPHMPLLAIMTNKYVLALALGLCGQFGGQPGAVAVAAANAESFGLTNMQVGLLNGIPFAVASVAMIWWDRRSDRTRERVASESAVSETQASRR